MTKLSERVQRLEGPDREIDRAIAEAIGIGWYYSQGNPEFRYTASLDAAMSLVPEGCTWNLSVGRVAIVQVTDCTGGPTVAPPDFEAHAATPAIALCAAALKARGL